MCYPKPGPRCHSHTHDERVKKEDRLETTKAEYATSIEELQRIQNDIDRVDIAYEMGGVGDEEYNRALDSLIEMRRKLTVDIADKEASLRDLRQKVRIASTEEHATKKGLEILKDEIDAEINPAKKRVKQLDYAKAERLFKHRHDAYQLHLKHQEKSREFKEKSTFLMAEAQAIEGSDPETAIIRQQALLEAEKFCAQSHVESQDGKYHFPALFNMNGDPVPAKIIKSKLGRYSWGILSDPNDTTSRITEYIGISRHSDPKKREEFYADKGYTIGKVTAPAVAAIIEDEKIGKKRVSILRSDGGYSPTVEVLTKNQYENIPTTS